MTDSARVLIAGIPLPADQLAEAIRGYATGRLLEERRTRAGGPAFRSEPWAAAARRLTTASVQVGDQLPPEHLPGPAYLSLNEYAAACGRSCGTVRRWIATGRLPGATRSAGRWSIPADTPPPQDRRKVSR